MENTQSHRSTPFALNKTGKLNALSALKMLHSDSEKLQRSAWNWIYDTYANFALLVCAKLARNNDFEDPEDYAIHSSQDVIQKFVLYLKDFKYDENQTPAGQNRIFKRYITNVSTSMLADECTYRIKDREYRQALKVYSELEYNTKEPQSYSERQVEADFQRREHYREKMMSLLAQLPEKDREIFTACLTNSTVENGNLILNKAIKEELMLKYDLKSNSVDQLKKRIIEKLYKLALESKD